MKHVGGIGRSPPRGTTDASAENQQFVATTLEEEPEVHGQFQPRQGRHLAWFVHLQDQWCEQICTNDGNRPVQLRSNNRTIYDSYCFLNPDMQDWQTLHRSGVSSLPCFLERPLGSWALLEKRLQCKVSSIDRAGASQPEQQHLKKRRQPEDRLAEAEEVLRRAGIDVEALREHKSKKRKKDKKEKRERKEKQRGEQ